MDRRSEIVVRYTAAGLCIGFVVACTVFATASAADGTVLAAKGLGAMIGATIAIGVVGFIRSRGVPASEPAHRRIGGLTIGIVTVLVALVAGILIALLHTEHSPPAGSMPLATDDHPAWQSAQDSTNRVPTRPGDATGD
ncbi:hypothetical protein [Paraburkholderia sp.]|uniref:hypothetical protein n=1 Tax=Paraburkholderia sp. TaxID=1926495 RepID=UPI003D701D0E